MIKRHCHQIHVKLIQLLVNGGLMNLSKRAVTIHGGREIFVLTPLLPNLHVTAGYNDKGDVLYGEMEAVITI
jgi:hypothetical protein